MGEFINTIKQVGIFMICAQGIMHFRKDGGYEKYLKLLVSIMVVIQLLIPIISLFQEEGLILLEERIGELSKDLSWNNEQLEKIQRIAEEKLEENISFQMELEQERLLNEEILLHKELPEINQDNVKLNDTNQFSIEKIEVVIDGTR